MASNGVMPRSDRPEHGLLEPALEPAGVTVRGGLPAPVVLAVALVLSVAADWVDLRLFGDVGALLSTGFIVGCVAAIVVVRPRGVLLVMLSTPLVLVAAVVIGVLAFTPGHSTAGMVMAVAQPLILHFPVLAGATALVLLVGGARLVLLRRAAGAQRSGPIVR
ncbi:MAG TPA: DUF6542 domain-containing protein [Amycolatopsis sp.]|jgi:hypothetical protein|nr:DUF6542 domain-containing protein [Amycolatopsis sp.]